MKAIIFFIAIVLSSQWCYGQLTEKVIGVNENGTYKITANLSELQSILEGQLKTEGNPTSLYKMEIRKDITEGVGGQEYYIIAGQNKIGNIKIAVDVELKGNTFIAKYSKANGTFSSFATCFGGCIKGCNPKKWIDSSGNIFWECTDCPGRSEACKKSVTINL